MSTIHRRRVVFSGLAGVLLFCAAATAEDFASLAGELRKLTASCSPPRMRVGVRVDALGEKPALVFESDSDELLKPASNQKVITTAAAMALLPADFTYKTVLARRGNDLIIIGSGDPSIGDPRLAQQAGEPITAIFHRWAEKLHAAGITAIDGDLLFDDTIFESEHVNPSWKGAFNLQEWYTAPVGGLNFNDNCVDVVCRPGRPGEPAEVKLIPATTWVQLQNSSKSAAKGQPTISRSGDGPLTIRVSGQISRASSPDDPFSLTIVDPGAFFASACRTALAAKGISIAGETRRQRVRRADNTLPGDLQIVATHERRLKDFLWRVNKCSQNMFAEALFKTVGLHTGIDAERIGSNRSGALGLEKFLKQIGVSTTGMVFADGSGLSHDNRTTASAMVASLRYMDRHPSGATYKGSFAIPGENIGTLKRRMKDLEEHVLAKTGTIRGVSSLSGYVFGPRGRSYAFSVLCNDTDKAKGGFDAARRLQDGLCRKLATWAGTSEQLGG